MVPESGTAKTWTIRTFRPDDLPALAAIATASTEASQWTPESYSEISSSRSGVLLIAQSDDEVIGFLAARRAANEAEVVNLAVSLAARRRGVASALLAAALEELGRLGITDIFLEVRASNSSAVALYRKFEFSVFGCRKGYYRYPVEDALCMMRKLTTPPG